MAALVAGGASVATVAATVPATTAYAAQVNEPLNRGVVSVRSGTGNLVTWRLLRTDPAGVGFNVYRGSVRVNGSPLTGGTNFLDGGAPGDASYTVRAVVNGVEQSASPPSLRFAGGSYLDVPLQIPPGGTTPAGEGYTYNANDASVGDVDGDGQYEIILKWDPSNAKDNAQAGYTGPTYIDAYRLSGARLWRIDLGRNIRSGAHYTQFQVFDYDGDGRAEVAMKTADGTRDGRGVVIGSGSADYRNADGRVLAGPEYLTMFNGLTGAAMSTVAYDPPRGTVSSWGDNYGNRVDRFLAATAYLDGTRPSLIMTRGYYARTAIAAWDFRSGALVKRWTFDSNVAGSQYAGQGNHNLSIADADGDGRDEIIFGAMAINDDGRPLWNTGYGHGDAMHVGDLIPSRPGLEVYKVSEDGSKPADWMADARTGARIWTHAACNCDNGRGVSEDIWAGSPGAESWSSSVPNLSNTAGQSIGRKPGSANFLIWWDGDDTRELLDRTQIDKYTPTGENRLLTGSGVTSNNGSKSTPALSGDILGDWREEVIWRTIDNRALRIYTTPHTTSRRVVTLMQDSQYRTAIAWQNTAYNQPPHLSFAIGGSTQPPAVAASRLQSYNFPDRYVRHADFDVRIDAAVSPIEDSQFRVVPGLANSSGYVSLESVNFPGYFLRHASYDFSLVRNDGSATFAADATFRQVGGLASASAVSYQSYNFPDRYIRHANYVLRLDPITDAAGRADATFTLVR